MKFNKVVINTDNGEQAIFDLTSDSVTADALVVGFTAHGADGEIVEGSNPYELESTNAEVQTQADLIEQIRMVLKDKGANID